MTTRPVPVAIRMAKRGRLVTIGKIVWLIPYGYDRPVLAIPYRHRRAVQTTMSLPLAVVQYARRCGCQWVVIRFDHEGRALRLTLDGVERLGWRRTTEAGAELFVALDRFEPCPPPEWPFVETTVVLDPVFETEPASSPAGQLVLEV